MAGQSRAGQAPPHFVDVHDGVVGARLQCQRCWRHLDEAQFKPIHRASRRRGRHLLVAVHPFCETCRRQLYGEWSKHPLYTAKLDRFWKKRWSSISSGCKGRGILCVVDKDDLLGLYLKQEGKCALTGIQLDYKTSGGALRGQRANLAPSVDRKDTHGNYTLDNVQIVANVVNIMKGTLSEDNFIRLCRSVVRTDRERRAAQEASISDIVEALCR